MPVLVVIGRWQREGEYGFTRTQPRRCNSFMLACPSASYVRSPGLVREISDGNPKRQDH